MPISEAQRKALRKYDKQHYTTISVKVSIQEAAAIRAACALLNTTASTVARRALLTIAESAGTMSALPDTATQAAAPDTTTQPVPQDTEHPAPDTVTQSAPLDNITGKDTPDTPGATGKDTVIHEET